MQFCVKCGESTYWGKMCSSCQREQDNEQAQKSMMLDELARARFAQEQLLEIEEAKLEIIRQREERRDAKRRQREDRERRQRNVSILCSAPELIQQHLAQAAATAEGRLEVVVRTAELLKDTSATVLYEAYTESPYEVPLAYRKIKELVGPVMTALWQDAPSHTPVMLRAVVSLAEILRFKDVSPDLAALPRWVVDRGPFLAFLRDPGNRPMWLSFESEQRGCQVCLAEARLAEDECRHGDGWYRSIVSSTLGVAALLAPPAILVLWARAGFGFLAFGGIVGALVLAALGTLAWSVLSRRDSHGTLPALRTHRDTLAAEYDVKYRQVADLHRRMLDEDARLLDRSRNEFSATVRAYSDTHHRLLDRTLAEILCTPAGVSSKWQDEVHSARPTPPSLDPKAELPLPEGGDSRRVADPLRSRVECSAHRCLRWLFPCHAEKRQRDVAYTESCLVLLAAVICVFLLPAALNGEVWLLFNKR